YKNINFSLDENQSILLETSGEIFGEIVNGNFYKIVSKNIFDNKKYHAIFTWGFVDKNGRVIKGQIENPCETFFPFQILKIHFPNFKDNLIGMKKGEIKIINLGNHKLVNEEGQEGSNIYIHLHEFIEIDWNRYYKEKGYPKFEKFADFFEWRINKQQKKNTEYNFVKDSYNVFKCIVEDCISFSEYENKLISSISAKLSYNYMKKMEDNKFDEYVWLVSSFAELDEDIMTKDNYIQTNNVGSMKEIFHFLFQLNLLELSWDSIFKEEKVEIKDIEWKSLALKKLHDDLEGKFTTYLYCSNETIFIEKQQLEQERLSEIEQFYLDSLTKIDILNFKFKAKKLKALKKIIFSKL
ncbi:MAG: hypothetical protein K2L64_02295, partial [Ureaplasma sp.]|nr:hypothetical protein [Ureaplasma sp.]